jgi:hypothetical protein
VCFATIVNINLHPSQIVVRRFGVWSSASSRMLCFFCEWYFHLFKLCKEYMCNIRYIYLEPLSISLVSIYLSIFNVLRTFDVLAVSEWVSVIIYLFSVWTDFKYTKMEPACCYIRVSYGTSDPFPHIRASFGICDPFLHKRICLKFYEGVKINEVVHEA